MDFCVVCYFRCRTLFYLHNVRSMLHLILLLVNMSELAESYLALGIVINESITISLLQIPCAWLSFISTVLLIIFIRICEIFDKSGKTHVYISGMHRTNRKLHNNRLDSLESLQNN